MTIVHDSMKYKPNRIRGPKYSSCALVPTNIATPESGTNKISVFPQHNCKKRLLASACLSVLLPVRTENQGSQWTEFCEIVCGIFGKMCQQN